MYIGRDYAKAATDKALREKVKDMESFIRAVGDMAVTESGSSNIHPKYSQQRPVNPVHRVKKVKSNRIADLALKQIVPEWQRGADRKYCRLCERSFRHESLYTIHIALCFKKWEEEHFNRREVISDAIDVLLVLCNYTESNAKQATSDATTLIHYSKAVGSIMEMVNGGRQIRTPDINTYIISELSKRLKNITVNIPDSPADFLMLYDYVEQTFLA